MNEEKITELRGKIRTIRESRRAHDKRSKPMTPPRYDEVFFKGIEELFRDPPAEH